MSDAFSVTEARRSGVGLAAPVRPGATRVRRRRSTACLVVLALVMPSLFACESQEDYRLHVARNFFDRNCARCHGSSKGEDPKFVEAHGAEAPDLRQLWKRYGTPLPREELTEFIDGRMDVEAHGPRAMPAWGETLYANLGENATVEEMRAGTIAMLIDYLDTIQAVEPD